IIRYNIKISLTNSPSPNFNYPNFTSPLCFLSRTRVARVPMSSCRRSSKENRMSMTLPAGITPPGSGKANASEDVSWNILGHVYWLKAQSDDCFAFETLDPPGTFVPPHVHPTQDEFIYMLEGTFDLYLDGSWTKA